jgi:hypothetical protein
MCRVIISGCNFTLSCKSKWVPHWSKGDLFAMSLRGKDNPREVDGHDRNFTVWMSFCHNAT